MLCQHPIAKAPPSRLGQHSTKTANQSTGCSYSLSPLEKNVHKFNASQTEIAYLFQVKRKKFFTSITGHEYDPGKKPIKSEKLKTSPTKKDTSTEKHTDEPQPSQPTTTEVDPEMPPLEDIRPKKKFRFKDPDSKHFPK